jgi:uncharacterized repeat protein (TIGR02543 family)
VQTLADNYVAGDYNLSINGGSFSKTERISAEGVRGNAFYSVPESLLTCLHSFGKTIYVSANGNDSNSGLTATKPVKSNIKVSQMLSEEYANKIVFIDKVSVTDWAFGTDSSKKLYITSSVGGVDYPGGLELDGNFYLFPSEVLIENTALYGTGRINTYSGSTVIGEGVTCDSDSQITVTLNYGYYDKSATITIESGSFESLSAETAWSTLPYVFKINGGTVKSIDAQTSAPAYIEINGGSVTDEISTNGMQKTVAILSGSLSGDISNTGGDFNLKLFGGDIDPAATFTKTGTGDATYEGNLIASTRLSGFTQLQNYIYVSSLTGSSANDGKSPLTPVKTIPQAVQKLSNGGTVVFFDEYSVMSIETTAAYNGTITYTSVFGGADYRIINGARLDILNGIHITGNLIFNGIDIRSANPDNGQRYIFCRGKTAVFGNDINTSLYEDRNVRNWVGIVGGEITTDNRQYSAYAGVGSLTIASGSWGPIYATNNKESGVESSFDTTGNISLNITGGTYYGGIYGVGMHSHTGDVTMNIEDAVVESSIYGIAPPSAWTSSKQTYSTINGDIVINIDSDYIHGSVIAVADPANTTFNGEYTLNLGESITSRISDIVGAENVSGISTSEININGLKYSASSFSQSGAISNNADPGALFYDGWYYYAYPSNKGDNRVIRMSRAANLADITKADLKTVWEENGENTGDHDIDSLWALQVNVVDGVFYLYGSGTDRNRDNLLTNETLSRYPYVWRAVGDGTDPFAGFECLGIIENADDSIAMWLSPRVFDYGGKTYLVCGAIVEAEDYVSRTVDPSDPHQIQKLIIGEMSSPTSFPSGSRMTVIAEPEYDWEKNSDSASRGRIWIEEGPFPITSPDGKFFFIFSAAETARDFYCTGLLEFTGDETDSLADRDNWYKHPVPIQQYTYGDTLFSPGAMIAVKEPVTDNYIALFHAKRFSITSNSSRQLYMLPITFDSQGLPTVPNADAALTSTSFRVNPKPISGKYSAFESVNQYHYVYFEDDGDTISEVLVLDGETVEEPSAPTKEGYEFVGWYEDDELTTEFDFNTIINDLIRIYAKFEEESDEFDITGDIFDAKGFAIKIGNENATSGLRFRSGIKSDLRTLDKTVNGYELVEYGILAKEYINANDLEYIDNTNDTTLKIGKSVSYSLEDKIDVARYEDDDEIVFAGAIVNFGETPTAADYTKKYTFRAYAVFTDESGENHYVYGTELTKSIYEIAQIAVLDPEYSENEYILNIIEAVGSGGTDETYIYDGGNISAEWFRRTIDS